MGEKEREIERETERERYRERERNKRAIGNKDKDIPSFRCTLLLCPFYFLPFFPKLRFPASVNRHMLGSEFRMSPPAVCSHIGIAGLEKTLKAYTSVINQYEAV